MSYPDPSAVKAAISGGAVWKSDRLKVGSTLHTLRLDDDVWSLSTDAPSMTPGSERYKISKITTQRIAGASILEDFRLENDGFWQLVPGAGGTEFASFAVLADA